MPCPTCQHNDTRVIDTRAEPGGAIARVRRCQRCRGTWKTVELASTELQRLLKLEAALQPFFREAA